MKFTIYQVKRDLTRDFGFMGLKERKEVLKTEEINLGLYDKVYEGDTNKMGFGDSNSPEDFILSRLWRIFNIEHPKGYNERSMSVSDIVEFKGKFFYCDSLGWAEVKPTTIRDQVNIGYDVKYREEDGEICSGYIHNFDFAKRPNTIEVCVTLPDGQEVLADLVPLDSIIEIKKPEGAEFAYLDEVNQ